jgi:hypothetical protein
MTQQQQFELTWIKVENRPRLEPRFMLQDLNQSVVGDAPIPCYQATLQACPEPACACFSVLAQYQPVLPDGSIASADFIREFWLDTWDQCVMRTLELERIRIRNAWLTSQWRTFPAMSGNSYTDGFEPKNLKSSKPLLSPISIPPGCQRPITAGWSALSRYSREVRPWSSLSRNSSGWLTSNIVFNPSLHQQLELRHCILQSLYARHYLERTQSEARRLAAALPTASLNKVGRNEPCPCGSGKKFKHCCLNRKPSS